MKVILVNGSPHKEGCTKTALKIVAEELNANGIKTEFFDIGSDVKGCMGCHMCARNKNGKCVIEGDVVNKFLEKAVKADGFVFGSPVYFASGSGSINAFMDRVFYVARNTIFPYKPGAALVSCRRAGSSAALDNLNKYLTISQMPVVTSRYWNMVHGNTPDEVRQDLEGVQIMQYIGRNMTWLLKNIEAGKKAGIVPPAQDKPARTNFIR